MGSTGKERQWPVSYTHLDVYKRQVFPHSREYNEANGVVTVPLPFDPLVLSYIYSRDRGLGETGEAYVRHLKERIREHFGEDG